MMSSWAKKFTRYGRDGYNVARVVVQHRGSNVKPLLLEQARQANTVANGLLRVDREVGLVKYYGLSGYLKQRLQSTSTLTASGDASQDNTLSSSGSRNAGDGAAKIAFMITASMKQELSELLGYSADQIKSMTPLQASLILNDRIQSEEMEAKLPIAEAAYEARRQEEEEEARIRAVHQATVAPTATQAQVVVGMGHDTQHFGIGAGYRSRNELDYVRTSSIGAFFSASEWFEVTEIALDGSVSRVGLYLDEDEAKLGLATRREIAEAKNTNLKFDMHRIPCSELEV
jgi:hypothetical protein